MGRLGRYSTGEDALQGADLTGKTAIVTGGNGGIGAETVRVFALAGARVIMTSRSIPRGQKVANKFKADGIKLLRTQVNFIANSQGEVVVKQLDLADLRSVNGFAADILATEERIDFLVLNGGVAGLPLEYTKDGFEMVMGTNHFGHFALTKELLPKMKSQAFPSRVVVVSSEMHERGHIYLDDLHCKNGRKHSQLFAYNDSKLANVLFASELARRLQGSTVSAFSLHPGLIDTDIFRHTSLFTYLWTSTFMRMIMHHKTMEQGVATTIYAAVSPELEGRSGAYLVDCAVSKPSKLAQDKELARKLWAVTERQLADPRTIKNPGAQLGKRTGKCTWELHYGALGLGLALGLVVAVQMKRSGVLQARKADP